MTALLNGLTFKLPDNWTPEGTMCVLVRIPNDQQYLGQLIGLLDTLKWSRNFQRDVTGTGAAIVSRTWEAALESDYIRVSENCEELEMSVERWRVKPGFPWISQYSHDSGVTWTDYLIQPNWSVSSTGIPNPNANGVTPGDIAAAILKNFYDYVTDRLVDAIQGGVPMLSVVDSLMAEFTPYGANADTREALENAYQVIEEMTEPTQDEIKGEETWCPSMPPMQQTLAEKGIDWLNHLSELLIQVLNETSSDLSDTLNAAAESMGMQLPDYVFSKGWQGGGAGGGGFGGGCPTVEGDSVTVSPNSFDYYTYTAGIFPAGTVYVRVSGVYQIAENILPCELSGRESDSQYTQETPADTPPWNIPVAGRMKFQNTDETYAPQLSWSADHIYLYDLTLPADNNIGVKWTAAVTNGCHEGEFLVEFSTTPFV